MPSTASSTRLGDRVAQHTAGPCTLYTIQTAVPEVISYRGSFVTQPDVGADEELLQELLVRMFDKGTQQRDRFQIAETLEERGAQQNFSSEGLRVEFYGRMLRAHVADVLDLLAEEFRAPALEAAEFDKARSQLIASLQRSLESTGGQASAALSRRIYARAHPNYTPPTQETIGRLQELTVADVQAYYTAHVGSNELRLVLAGDVDEAAAVQAVAGAFDGWAPHDAPAQYASAAEPQEPGVTDVLMPGKQNIDVRMGHAIPLKRTDPDYVALYLANFALGGDFSARLMDEVRDERGLTYGIGSSLTGLTAEVEGHWQVDVTLSADRLEEGVAATREVIKEFVAEGVSAEELQAKKETVVGSFTVGLASSRALANVLHLNAVRGYDPTYLDRFREALAAATLGEVNQAIATYLDLEALQVARAGAVPQGDDDPTARL